MNKFFRNADSTTAASNSLIGISSPFLLVGPPSSGKTSLLWQYAYNAASSLELNVLFFCQKQKLEKSPVKTFVGMCDNETALKRIQIMYINSGKELQKELASIQLSNTHFSLIVVDEISEYQHGAYGNDRLSSIAKSVAFLKEAVDYLQAKYKSPCELIVSEIADSRGMPKNGWLLSKWIPTMLETTTVIEDNNNNNNNNDPPAYLLTLRQRKREDYSHLPPVERPVILKFAVHSAGPEIIP